jgi:hypothetical protein
MRVRVYNADGEMRQFVGEKVPEGWYLEPPPPKLLTDDIQKRCDDRLSHTWGFTLASFTEIMMGSKSPHYKEQQKELFDKVIATYGNKIELVKRSSSEVYKWRQQPQ